MSRKYFFILETLLGFAILLAIDLFLIKNSTAFEHITPHPFWIVVLLIAVRYGTLQGIFAGSFAAVAYVALASGTASAEFSRFSFPHGPYNLPFFFILTGGVLGEIRGWHKKMHDNLQKKYEDKARGLECLSVEHEALCDSKHELDKRVAFQATTMVSLFEKLTNLEQLQPLQLYQNIPDLLADQLNVTRSSVYLLRNNKLEMVARNSNYEDGLPDVVDLDFGMMGEVVKNKSLVTINQMLAEDHNEFDAIEQIMAAPILRKDETLLGIINIERIPFFDYNSNSVRIFEVLAYWVSIVADQAMQFERLKDKNIADEITGAYNYPYFQKRLQYEISRAKRFHSSLSLLLLRIKHFDEMNDSERKNVLVVLNWIFDHTLRDVDIIAKYADDNTFSIILPGQNSLESEKITEDLCNEIVNYGMRPFEDRETLLEFEVGLSVLQPSEGGYESLMRTAEERLAAEGQREITPVFDDIHFLLNKTKDSSEPGNEPIVIEE